MRSQSEWLLTLAQGAQPGAAASAPASAAPQSILDYIIAGGFLSFVLVALSIVALALFVRNVIELRLERLAPIDLVEGLEERLKKNRLEDARAYCEAPENGSLITRVWGSALARCLRSPFGKLELRSSLEESGQAEFDKLHRLNDWVGIIAAIGPMLGLLGTVIGMIGAFGVISQLQGAARSNELAKFMSMALVNTAEGLIVAIPCTVAYALFRRRIGRLAGEITETVERLVGAIDQKGEAGEAPKAGPSIGAPARPVTRPAASAQGGPGGAGAPARPAAGTGG